MCGCVGVCQRKTNDRADRMREKGAHSPRRDSNLCLWDSRPPCFRKHYEGRHGSCQSKQTFQTLTRQLHRETIMNETLQLLSVGPRRQASARTSTESDEACQRKMKERAVSMREKVPIPLDEIRTCTSGTRAYRASDYTTRAGTPRQSKQTLQTLTRQIHRETSMHETLQLLSAGPRRQALARTSAESDEACQRKTKDRADGWREKSAHSP